MAEAAAQIGLDLRAERIPAAQLVGGEPPAATATKVGEGRIAGFDQRHYVVRVVQADVQVQLNRGIEAGDAERLRSVIERYLWCLGAQTP